MNRQTIDRLIQMSDGPVPHGGWKAFCQREGVGYQTLRHWREKLQLRRRKKSVNPAVHPTTA